MANFDLFWQHYPLKKGKGYARKCFAKVKVSDEVILKAINDQIKEKQYLRSQNRFVPEWKNPSTWINQECWSDECFLPQKAQTKRQFANSIDTLHRAYNILKNLCAEKFESYCQQVRLTPTDRECVLNRHHGIYTEDKARKIAGSMLREIS